jgi:two-component system, cell cycle sensor histidine kinase and response regulator CckA
VTTASRFLEDRPLARIVGLYLLVGGLWIVVTDRVLGMMTSDPALLLQLQTVKGWVFVLASGLLIYALVRSSLKRLRHTEDLVKQVAEHTSASIWSYAANDSEVLYLSPSSEAVWGRKLADMYRDPRFFEEHIHPDHRDDTLATLRGSAGKMALEYRIIRGDGAVRWLRTISTPVRDDAGRVERTVGITEDVTEEKRAEEELMLLAAAVEQAGEAVLVTDAQGVIQYVNPAFEEITGYSREDALGQTPRMLKSGKQSPTFYRHMWANLERGEPWRGRIVNRRSDGALYTQETVITPVRSGGGEITHMVSVFGDVSERIRLEEQFRQAQKLEAIGRLAGGIAHDFNNVLTVIDGHAKFALDDLPPGDALRADIQEIVAAADRAARLTRQLLTFSRQQVNEPVVLDVGEVIGRAEGMLGRLIGDDVDLEVSVAPHLSRILADSTQIEQVLTNLVINASDAMPGGGRIRIEAANVELDEDFTHRFAYAVRAGRYVRLTISDTGSGMDPDTMERIFEPFFSTKDRDRGTGLGLATVYGIVKQSNGYIWVYSEPGEGTTFKVYLPCTDREPTPLTQRPHEAEEPTGTETILVVEDQDSVRALVRRVLERAGYVIRDAPNGEAALRALEQDADAIDLLLTDVVMPGFSGRELSERARAIRPELPVLFMSGYAEHEIARRGALGPEMHLIEKPFEHRALQRKVREVLDGRTHAR